MIPSSNEHLAYRLGLTGVAGWLAAWAYLPEGVFSGPHDTISFYLPGTVFGLLVLVPLLEDPARHWVRSAILLCTATLAHWALWATGFAMYGVLENVQLEESILETGAIIVLGGPAGLVFGLMVTLAAARTMNIQFEWYNWIAVALLSCLSGTLYAGILLDQWKFLEDMLFISVINDFNVHVAYMVSYLVYAMVFTLGKQRPLAKPTKLDMILVGGLVLLTSLSVAWFSMM